MAKYRLFFIGRDKHIFRADVVDCPTDSDALAIASRSCRDDQAVEVWELGRLVDRIDINANADVSTA